MCVCVCPRCKNISVMSSRNSLPRNGRDNQCSNTRLELQRSCDTAIT